MDDIQPPQSLSDVKLPGQASPTPRSVPISVDTAPSQPAAPAFEQTPVTPTSSPNIAAPQPVNGTVSPEAANTNNQQQPSNTAPPAGHKSGGSHMFVIVVAVVVMLALGGAIVYYYLQQNSGSIKTTNNDATKNKIS